MRFRRARLIPLLSVIILTLIACTGGKSGGGLPAANPKAGGTLTVGMGRQAFFGFDPQNEWAFSPWELFRCCLLRTLMSYNGTDGPTGAEPQPDLAAAPPDVSMDGLTWTFHLRPGLHYGPPMQGVQITSPDIVRALLRSGDPKTSNPGLGQLYLSDIAGYMEYAASKTDSISGLETPDPLTLLIREVRPDASLPFDMTLATTAPIPPSPSDPSARYGVATGHDRSSDPSKTDGYGSFLVSSGPYMIQGMDAVDFSAPAAQQVAPSGIKPWTYDSNYNSVGYGSLTLVRNPSWDPATDPLRAALPDQIVIKGGSPDALFRQVGAGGLAMVFDDTPPPTLLHRYLNDPALRPFVQTVDGGDIVVAAFNLTQPPFDDPAVRKAVAFALNRKAMIGPIRSAYGFGAAVVANHYVTDSAEASLASGWSPFPASGGAPDLQAARRAMAGSRYASGGRCTDPVCRDVTILFHQGLGPVPQEIGRSLAALGIHARVEVPKDFYGACNDPKVRHGMCVGDGWFPDLPSTSNGLIAFFAGPSIQGGDSLTHLGAPPSELARLQSPVRSVPSVDPQIEACQREVGARGIACWTRLDQYLLTQLMPSVPLAFAQEVRVTSPALTSFSWDQAFVQPALDRLSVAHT